jgi:hypothetical protein
MMPMPCQDADSIFAEFVQELPPELEAMAREFKAFCRARKIKTVAQLLRAVVLFAGLDLSEREVAANLVLSDPALNSLSDEAVRQRLRACQPWLQALLPKLLQRQPLPSLPSHLRLLVIDASNVVAPGQKKTSYRLHVAMELVSLQVVWVQITDGRTGETLKNFQFAAGDVVMVDRGYCRQAGVVQAVVQGAELIVRYHPHLFPVDDPTGQPLKLAAALSEVAPGETMTLAVSFQSDDGQTHRAWIHSYRLSGAAARGGSPPGAPRSPERGLYPEGPDVVSGRVRDGFDHAAARGGLSPDRASTLSLSLASGVVDQKMEITVGSGSVAGSSWQSPGRRLVVRQTPVCGRAGSPLAPSLRPSLDAIGSAAIGDVVAVMEADAAGTGAADHRCCLLGQGQVVRRADGVDGTSSPPPLANFAPRGHPLVAYPGPGLDHQQFWRLSNS